MFEASKYLYTILPLIIGHRCIPQYAPENSLSGLIIANKMNVRCVEVDAMLSKDKVPIIFHDYTLDRCCGDSAKIKDRTYEQLLKYDISNGFYVSDRFEGERIPMMKTVIEKSNELNMILNIEIKCLEDDIITPMVICNYIKRYGNPKNLVVSSFNEKSLIIAKNILKEYERNLISDTIPIDYFDKMKRLNCTSIILSSEKNNFQDLLELLKYQYPVFVFTVNNSQECEKYISNGIGVFTDNPYTITKYIYK